MRWLKFTKYLHEFGWEPIIYTPLNPESQEIDDLLIQEIPAGVEVIRTRIWEPYGIYKRLTGRKQSDRLGVALMSDNKSFGWMNKFSLWIRSNLFIPDPKKFWINPSVHFLKSYLSDHPVDAIITTGPPHSMHLIGLGLKKKTGIKWIADFRDPWTDIDFYKDLLLTSMADRYHKKLEGEVLSAADCIVTVSDSWAADLRRLGANDVRTITNGFDYETEPGDAITDTGRFTLLHLGSMPLSRNPVNLWKVLSEIAKSSQEFASRLQIKLIGKVDQKVLESIRQNGLTDFICQVSFVPHERTLTELKSASILLLVINNTPNAQGILTNKFYEYLSAYRPILAIGRTDGNAAITLNETKAGSIFDYNNIDDLKVHIEMLFRLHTQKLLKVDPQNIDKYSRRNLTRQLSILLNELESKTII